MILDTSLKLEGVLAGAITTSNPEVQVDYLDYNQQGMPTLPASFRVALNGNTDVTILAAPTVPNQRREALRISIYNKDTVAVTVTVKTDDSTTERILLKATLQTLESLNWEKSRGWYCLDASGNTKQIAAQSIVYGTTTNDSASAGVVGEFVSSTVLTASAVSLTSTTPANVTSISLTRGDWDVYFVPIFTPDASTSVTYMASGINTTTDTLPAGDLCGQWASAANVIGNEISLPAVPQRISIASTTTVYGVARGDFTVSTLKAYGRLFARRRR